MKFRTLLLFAALFLGVAFLGAACSSSTTADTPVAETSSASEAVPAAQDADDAGSADDSGQIAPAVPGGEPAATLTVGDQTWAFDVLICSISIPEEGQIPVGSTVTAMNSELRLSLTSHPQAGDFASLTDFEFDNPAVSLSSDAPATEIAFEPNSFSGSGEFVDLTTASLDLTPGTFTGTCS